MGSRNAYLLPKLDHAVPLIFEVLIGRPCAVRACCYANNSNTTGGYERENVLLR
jgi:hypothetical protein